MTDRLSESGELVTAFAQWNEARGRNLNDIDVGIVTNGYACPVVERLLHPLRRLAAWVPAATLHGNTASSPRCASAQRRVAAGNGAASRIGKERHG
jgi:hypothetical protein